MERDAAAGRAPAVSSEHARVRALARLLDAAVRVPGTDIRVGLDALIGLIPGVGDVAGLAFSGYIVLAAARLGVPAPVVLRMLLNLATDTVVGAVPVLGDLFDVSWRANLRNAALLDRHLAAPAAARTSSRGLVAAVVGGVVLLAAGAITIGVLVVRALAQLAT